MRGRFFNFIVVIPKIMKIFRTAIPWTSAGSYFLYYVIERSFLLVKRIFICIYFNGGSGRSLLKVCVILFHQDYLLFPIHKPHFLQLGVLDLYFPLILQDIRGWNLIFSSFYYFVDNFESFLFFSALEYLFLIWVAFLKSSFVYSFRHK